MPGEKIFERACSQCHSIERPLSKNKDIEGWRRTVAAMRARGAQLTEEEAGWVVEYLHAIRPEK
jgi:mono/diheme cytochrome c family protein